MSIEWTEYLSPSLHAGTLLARVLPTRVRRNYAGGRLLDRMERVQGKMDEARPESWIGSTVVAINAGFPSEPDEGVTRLRLADGSLTDLRRLIASDPVRALGREHRDRFGDELGFIAKLLDPDMRLQLQAHPSSEFARARMGKPFGKLEVYYVLSVGAAEAGYIWLGFQRPPSREEWKSMLEGQDLAGMSACFDRIAVRPGEVWLVPGGLPHAIGEGVLLVEIMEPSDLVVRCEFERDGVVVPPEGRYMGRDLDFCLDVFDYGAYSVDDVRRRFCLEPRLIAAAGDWRLDSLVDSAATDCFEVRRLRLGSDTLYPMDGRCALIALTKGAAIVHSEGNCIGMRQSDSCFVAAATWEVEVKPLTDEVELLIVHPGGTPQKGVDA